MNKNSKFFLDESKINSILKKKGVQDYKFYNPAKFSITKTPKPQSGTAKPSFTLHKLNSTNSSTITYQRRRNTHKFIFL